jgi:hypothetical protein
MQAITNAGIMGPDETDERVVMVTEAEASVHFSLQYVANGDSDWLKVRTFPL